jgi:hypothetical protein
MKQTMKKQRGEREKEKKWKGKGSEQWSHDQGHKNIVFK